MPRAAHLEWKAWQSLVVGLFSLLGLCRAFFRRNGIWRWPFAEGECVWISYHSRARIITGGPRLVTTKQHISGACLLAILYLSFWLSRACGRMVLCMCSINLKAGPPCFIPLQRSKLAIPVYLKCSENHWYKAMWSVGLSCHKAIFCKSRYWEIATSLGCSNTLQTWEGNVRRTCWARFVWCFRFSHNVVLAIMNKHKASSTAKLLLLLLKPLGKIQVMRQAQMSVTVSHRDRSTATTCKRIIPNRVSMASESNRTISSCSCLFMCAFLLPSSARLHASSHFAAQCHKISVAEKFSVSWISFGRACRGTDITSQKDVKWKTKSRNGNWKAKWEKMIYGYMEA